MTPAEYNRQVQQAQQVTQTSSQPAQSNGGTRITDIMKAGAIQNTQIFKTLSKTPAVTPAKATMERYLTGGSGSSASGKLSDRDVNSIRAIIGDGYKPPQTMSVFQQAAQKQAMMKALDADLKYREARISERDNRLNSLENRLNTAESNLKSYDRYISNDKFNGTPQQYKSYQNAFNNYNSLANSFNSTLEAQNVDIKTYNKNAASTNKKKSINLPKNAKKVVNAYVKTEKYLSSKLPSEKAARPVIEKALNSGSMGLPSYAYLALKQSPKTEKHAVDILEFNVGVYSAVRQKPLKAAATFATFAVGGVVLKGLGAGAKALGAGANTAKVAGLLERGILGVYVLESGARVMSATDARSAGFATGDIIFNELLPAGLGMKYGIKVVSKIPSNAAKLDLKSGKLKYESKLVPERGTTFGKKITKETDIVLETNKAIRGAKAGLKERVSGDLQYKSKMIPPKQVNARTTDVAKEIMMAGSATRQGAKNSIDNQINSIRRANKQLYNGIKDILPRDINRKYYVKNEFGELELIEISSKSLPTITAEARATIKSYKSIQNMERQIVTLNNKRLKLIQDAKNLLPRDIDYKKMVKNEWGEMELYEVKSSSLKTKLSRFNQQIRQIRTSINAYLQKISLKQKEIKSKVVTKAQQNVPEGLKKIITATRAEASALGKKLSVDVELRSKYTGEAVRDSKYARRRNSIQKRYNQVSRELAQLDNEIKTDAYSLAKKKKFLEFRRKFRNIVREFDRMEKEAFNDNIVFEPIIAKKTGKPKTTYAGREKVKDILRTTTRDRVSQIEAGKATEVGTGQLKQIQKVVQREPVQKVRTEAKIEAKTKTKVLSKSKDIQKAAVIQTIAQATRQTQAASQRQTISQAQRQAQRQAQPQKQKQTQRQSAKQRQAQAQAQSQTQKQRQKQAQAEAQAEKQKQKEEEQLIQVAKIKEIVPVIPILPKITGSKKRKPTRIKNKRTARQLNVNAVATFRDLF
jgi:hypothetical protein